jgi:hypothetical protein
MESAKQERKNLMKDMPIDKRASGGSWMSKHSQSRMGGSPAMLKDAPMEMKEKGGMMMKDAPMEMGHKSPAKKGHSPMKKGHSPMEKELVGKQKNLPEALKAKIEAAPEMKYKK